LNASTIILGFTGSIGSGCTYISSAISKTSEKKYKYYKLSQLLRDYLKSKGVINPTVEELQDLGNNLRREKGPSNLVKRLIKDVINKDASIKGFDGVIVDGIKNQAEVFLLRQFPYFFLFSVISDENIRCKRSIENKIFKNRDDFLQADNRDKLENYEYGQQVKICSDLADIEILNNKQIPKASHNRRNEYIENIYNRYIRLIENLREGKQSEDIQPTPDELFMTVAYSLSKRSSCVKRKVGSVIVDNASTSGTVGSQGTEMVLGTPFIVSSGYNEVPIGSYKCIFHPDYEMCYRDYLQQEHANKIKHCPNCGAAVTVKSKCNCCKKEYDGFVKFCKGCRKEISILFKCNKCDIAIFEEYLPGGKETPGKLLDLCRSLHAEENAIMKLVGIDRKYNGELVLYVTAQPCNLCANKIVTAGIKKVVFSEPYEMKEATKILEAGGVTLQRFEGIKSTAYYKLYK